MADENTGRPAAGDRRQQRHQQAGEPLHAVADESPASAPVPAPVPAIVPEMSRLVPVAHLSAQGVELAIEADTRECDGLCRRFELQALDRLRAVVRVARHGSREVMAVTGSVEAQLVQSCVVSLEPVPASLAFTFERLFITGALPDEAEVIVDPAELDLEPLDGAAIDVGELVAEELAVNLDPYPHAPGVARDDAEADADTDAGGPFAALERLKPGHDP